MKQEFSPEYKAYIALEAIKGEKTIEQLVEEFDLDEAYIIRWKDQFLYHASDLFESLEKKQNSLAKYAAIKLGQYKG